MKGLFVVIQLSLEFQFNARGNELSHEDKTWHPVFSPFSTPFPFLPLHSSIPIFCTHTSISIPVNPKSTAFEENTVCASELYCMSSACPSE